MDVADALAQDTYPVFWELEHHDVAGVEVYLHVFAVEAVNKGVHLRRRHQIAVEEYVLDIQGDAEFLREGQQLADGVARPAVADIVGHRLMVRPPRNVHGAGDNEQVLDAEFRCGLHHFRGQIHAARPLGRIVARQWIRPKQKRTQAADGDADVVRHFPDRL